MNNSFFSGLPFWNQCVASRQSDIRNAFAIFRDAIISVQLYELIFFLIYLFFVVDVDIQAWFVVPFIFLKEMFGEFCFVIKCVFLLYNLR